MCTRFFRQVRRSMVVKKFLRSNSSARESHQDAVHSPRTFAPPGNELNITSAPRLVWPSKKGTEAYSLITCDSRLSAGGVMMADVNETASGGCALRFPFWQATRRVGGGVKRSPARETGIEFDAGRALTLREPLGLRRIRHISVAA